jgi:hypothetical protein
MLICGECGHHNEDRDTFCGSCGTFLEWNAERVAPAPVATPEQLEPLPRKAGLLTRIHRAALELAGGTALDAPQPTPTDNTPPPPPGRAAAPPPDQ